MKRKNYIFSLASALCLGAAALAMTACSSEDNIVSNNQPQNAEARTYTINIPATFGDDAQTRAVTFDNTGATPTAITSFATTDKIYVYRKSPTTAWLSYNGGNYDYLSPTNISGDGRTCTLSGTINGQFAEGDVLELYYNMNNLYSSADGCIYDYTKQDGTQAGVADFAIATVKVKSIDAGNVTFCKVTDDTDEKAHFENLSSMFRFKFTDGTNPISVKRLHVGSTNLALLGQYLPVTPDKVPLAYGVEISVNLATATSDYIYVGIGIDESENNGAAMTFDVEGADGKVYTGSKDAPGAGFKKGKYYYSTSATTLAYQYTIQYPTITWTTPSTAVEPDLGLYRFAVDNFDITLSGTSSYVRFSMGGTYNPNGTVRLNGLTATYDDDCYIFSHANLILDITGNNTITCKNMERCIYAWARELKLSGNGTLTVTSNSPDYCGLEGTNYRESNNNHATTTELDVSAALAADGHVVTRSARTDNGDGTYTWTYTVTDNRVHLNKLTGNYVAQNGDVLTGTLGDNYQISIADGATVTLADANITCLSAGANYAGITCLGDATILLSGTNSVKGGIDGTSDSDGVGEWPGIFVPNKKTLTIDGTGTLNASSGGINNEKKGASGIGASPYANCGSIVIQGGNITATGGINAAGIGSSYRFNSFFTCGPITITGSANVTAYGGSNGAGIGNAYNGTCGKITISTTGTVTATGGDHAAGIGTGFAYGYENNCSGIEISNGTIVATGGSGAAGIGTGTRENGTNNQCSSITITNGVTRVTATKGDGATDCIGRGSSATTCGTVKIGGTTYWDGNSYPDVPKRDYLQAKSQTYQP